MKLEKKNLFVVSVMLFALFFGAGNLIFPPFLGQNAGSHTLPATLGFLATAVILPVLGVVVVARFDGLEQLGSQVGKRFALVFTVLIYLSIGPDSEYRGLRPFLLKWPLRRIFPEKRTQRFGCSFIPSFFSLLQCGFA